MDAVPGGQSASPGKAGDLSEYGRVGAGYVQAFRPHSAPHATAPNSEKPRVLRSSLSENHLHCARSARCCGLELSLGDEKAFDEGCLPDREIFVRVDEAGVLGKGRSLCRSLDHL